MLAFEQRLEPTSGSLPPDPRNNTFRPLTMTTPHHPELNNDEISLLAEISKALLPAHGARAVEVVKRVTDQTRNIREIVQTLAVGVNDAEKRAYFMRRAKLAVEKHRAQKTFFASGSGASKERRLKPLTSEQMVCAEEVVSVTLGAQASVLVARYASSTDNSRDFFEQLSTHLPTSKERTALFKAARKLSRNSKVRQ